MEPRIPERHRTPGVCYAVTDDGVELPVLDVTHPAFRLDPSAEDLAAATQVFLAEGQRRARLPRWVFRALLPVVLRDSVLGAGIRAARGRVLSGMSTYLLKLGPENLGAGWARPLDKVIAAALPALHARLRVQDLAHLLAAGLAPRLRAHPGRAVHLVNLGGGACADSLNALLLLQRDAPGVLAGRDVRVHALDPDPAGPAFAARALHVLGRPGAALHGVDAQLVRHPWDWNRPAQLRAVLAALDPAALLAVSSEGALFEYPPDTVVGDNLEVMRALAPADTVVTGSVTSDSAAARENSTSSEIPLQLRSPEAFARLAARHGWRVEQVVERPLSRQVRMVKA